MRMSIENLEPAQKLPVSRHRERRMAMALMNTWKTLNAVPACRRRESVLERAEWIAD